MRKYVLTGGPCTGKTTTLKALMRRGFHTIPETPRVIIEEQQAVNGTILPWKDISLFQLEIFKRQTEFESQLKQGTTAFLDRGFVDAIAYCRFYGIDAPKSLVGAAEKNRYDGIFFLEMLPKYEVDSVRKEDFSTAKKIHETIRDVYREFNYDVAEVPPVSVEERIGIILSKIQPTVSEETASIQKT